MCCSASRANPESSTLFMRDNSVMPEHVFPIADNGTVITAVCSLLASFSIVLCYCTKSLDMNLNYLCSVTVNCVIGYCL